VSGLAPGAPADSVRPRRASGVVVWPLNFTDRRRRPPMNVPSHLTFYSADYALDGSTRLYATDEHGAERAVRRLWFRAAGAENQCAPVALIGRQRGPLNFTVRSLQ